jgi:chorismate--pyruvate lyase
MTLWELCYDNEIGELSKMELCDLDRDLRILIATNGTLTRILEVMSDEEIRVEIIDQGMSHDSLEIPEFRDLPSGRVLRRQILLMGRSSGVPFVAAESLIATDYLPTAIRKTLAETDRPIGEVILSSGLETFKDPAKVWVADMPGWVPRTSDLNSRSKVVARRYRQIAGGLPILLITEFFLREVFW